MRPTNFLSLFSPPHSSETLHTLVGGVPAVSLTAPPPHVSTDTQCRTTSKADIVLLVDGSWSIGRMNFKTIRNFIARMVSVFDIGPDKIQIGNVFTAVFVLLLMNQQP